jgi:MFS family permease
MMIPVGRIAIVRTFARSELIRTMSFIAIPGLVGPMLGPIAGGLIVAYLHWRVIFFINIPVGLTGLYLVYRHLPDYREAKRTPLDVVGMILFGSGIALLSYVLEVFGETSLSGGEMLGLLAIAATLLAGYAVHATSATYPLLRLPLFRIRTFRAAVSGGFLTRLGIGGIPFLFPLLYQVGLGFTPVQSGLMLMPQAFAAMSLKLTMPWILARFGYRRVLVTNTVAIGGMIALFATIGLDTPVWLVVIEVFTYGFFSSLQYTSMNTLAFADVTTRQTSAASTIASTLQQLSISFGIAAASLVTAAFIPDRFHSTPPELIHGIHLGFLVLGAMTVVSTVVFAGLRRGDGDAVSRPKAMLPSGP